MPYYIQNIYKTNISILLNNISYSSEHMSIPIEYYRNYKPKPHN